MECLHSHTLTPFVQIIFGLSAVNLRLTIPEQNRETWYHQALKNPKTHIKNRFKYCFFAFFHVYYTQIILSPHKQQSNDHWR